MATAAGASNEQKLIIERALQRYATYYGVINDDLLATSNWMVATLVALNSSAIVALLNFNQVQLSKFYLIGSVAIFGFGIAAAILSAFVKLYNYDKLSGVISTMQNLYTSAMVTGDLDQGEVAKASGGLSNSHRYLKFADKLLYASAVLFFVASLVFGAALVTHQDFAKAQCRALETDMFSSKPHRKDSRDLFSALACKPSGLGRIHY